MRVSLKVKLLGSFVFILLLMSFIAYMALGMGTQMNNYVQQLGKDRLVKVQLAGDLRYLLSEYGKTQILGVDYAKAGNIVKVQECIKKNNDRITQGDKVNSQLGSIIKSDTDKKLYGDFNTYLKEYFGYDAQLKELATTGRFDEALALSNGKAREALDKASNALNELNNSTNSQAQQLIEQAADSYSNTRATTVVVVVPNYGYSDRY